MHKSLSKASLVGVHFEETKLRLIKRDRATMVVFISLFTSILALLVLIISLIDLEPSTPKRNFQKMMHSLAKDVAYQQQIHQFEWLNVENTFSKGIKLTIKPDYLKEQNLFANASAQLNSFYDSYVRSLSYFIHALAIETFAARHQKLIKEVQASGYEFFISIRIEGYTDAKPMAKGAIYKDNLQLSTFRAFSIMQKIRQYTRLKASFFSIAGYGDRRPLTKNPKDAKNRRIEIYIMPELVERGAIA